MERKKSIHVKWLFACYFIVTVSPININAANEPIQTKEAQRFEPTWESLDTRVAPEWYDKAKVGIFIHFGVFSAAGFRNEWFWYDWVIEKRPDFVEFMERTQRPSFNYQEFAKTFTCEHFNASYWADMFHDSGAQYVVLTSKHHEGYTLYPSTYSFSWNSVDIGPKRDIIKELSEAVRKKDMKFGLYYSLYEWFNRMYLEDKKNGFFENSYVQKKVFPELKEIVNLYKPDVVWSDGDFEAPYQYWKSREFLAWLYNDSPVKDTVVVNDRWGKGVPCNHGDFITCSDRWNPGRLVERKFENAMTIDTKSWGHRKEAKLEEFLTADEIIKEIVTTVAINGNILVNVNPTKHGVIEAIYAERLQSMGKWLRINGKAIYETRPWTHQKEGDNIWFTMKSGPRRDSVFVFVLEYPFDTNYVVVEALKNAVDDATNVKLLGHSGFIEKKITDVGLKIQFPDKRFSDQEGLFSVWTFEVDVPKKK